jgi:hypothetical protein
MNILRCITFLILLAIDSRIYSQEITNVDFKVKDNTIIVEYDLLGCSPKQAIDVGLVVTCNGKTTVPSSITGDVMRVACGRQKRIEWNVLNDEQELKGPLQVAVNITKVHSTKITGGPSNAFLSMLLPGAGTYFVNRPSKNWFYVSLLYVGSAYFAFSSRIRSKDFYDKYHAATTQADMDAAYEEANSYYQTYQFMLGAMAVIWVSDVTYVTIKGFMNRKKQMEGLAMKEPRVRLFLVVAPTDFRFGLVKKF